jgi:hypothetical protein
MSETFRSTSTQLPKKTSIWHKSVYNKDSPKMKKTLRPSLFLDVTQHMLAVVYWHCVASHRSKGCNYTMVEA